MFAAGTTLRIEGELANLRLLKSVNLPEAPEATLTNTVVRMSVDSTGRTISAALLSSCGTARLDQEALEYARRARFAPVPASPADATASARLAFGTFVFQWWRANWEKLGPATARN